MAPNPRKDRDHDSFVAAGFYIEQMGGGTTAWFRGLPDGFYILITDNVVHRLHSSKAGA